MTNENNPSPDEHGSTPPPPPPAGGPPPPPPNMAREPAPSSGKSDNTVMLVLSYLWILCLVPFFVEKEDREVAWHARNGIVITAAEIIAWVAVSILSAIPFINIIGCFLFLALWIGALVLRIMAIVKATKGERFLIPGVSEYADKIG